MKFNKLALVVALGVFSGTAMAVSADQAAKLGAELTPVGAEKAGNADGTIPAWDGGITKAPAGFKEGDHYPNPFASEKP
ncbi:MAG: hypothetical protein ABIM24_03820, partial [Paraperlucidibaca sp.]